MNKWSPKAVSNIIRVSSEILLDDIWKAVHPVLIKKTNKGMRNLLGDVLWRENISLYVK